MGLWATYAFITRLMIEGLRVDSKVHTLHIKCVLSSLMPCVTLMAVVNCPDSIFGRVRLQTS